MQYAKDNFITRINFSDKFQHFGVCFSGMYILKIHFSLPFWLMGLIIFTLGFLWEVKDSFYADGFSWRDLTADLLGIIAAGLLLIGLWYYGIGIIVICYLLWEELPKRGRI